MQARAGFWPKGIGTAGAALLLWLASGWPALAAPTGPGDSPGPDAESPTPASATPAPDDAAIATNLMISPGAASRARRAACEESRRQGEIVVCGFDRGEQWRVPSTAESDPASRQGRDTGVPSAPNVSSLPDCSRGCIGFGKVPPPVYVVDFSKLPEAPKGSDADRIAKGEMPAP